jgi:bacterioferritin (cytochrome b1)
MTKADIKSGLNITRERVIQLLNGDLAGECQQIIAYTVFSQVPKTAAHRDIRRELEMPACEELRPATKIGEQVDYLCGPPGMIPKPIKTQGKDIHGD